MTDAEKLALLLQQDRSVPMATPTGEFVPTPPLNKLNQASPYNPIGIGETILSLGTGAVATPLAGWYGAGTELFGGDGKAAAGKLADALTYKPTTDYGQASASAFSDFADKTGISSLPPVVSGIPTPRLGAGATRYAGQQYGMPMLEKSLTMYEQGKLTPGFKPVSEMADISYRGSHAAPNAETYGATLDNLTGIMPKDVYTQQGKSIYGLGNRAVDHEWYMAALKAKGNPDADVVIYRAVPKGVKDINSGDWVTTSKTYAKDHGENTLNGDYEIVSKTVKAKSLSTEGYPYEFGYHEPHRKELLQQEFDKLNK